MLTFWMDEGVISEMEREGGMLPRRYIIRALLDVIFSPELSSTSVLILGSNGLGFLFSGFL